MMDRADGGTRRGPGPRRPTARPGPSGEKRRVRVPRGEARAGARGDVGRRKKAGLSAPRRAGGRVAAGGDGRARPERPARDTKSSPKGTLAAAPRRVVKRSGPRRAEGRKAAKANTCARRRAGECRKAGQCAKRFRPPRAVPERRGGAARAADQGAGIADRGASDHLRRLTSARIWAIVGHVFTRDRSPGRISALSSARQVLGRRIECHPIFGADSYASSHISPVWAS